MSENPGNGNPDPGPPDDPGPPEWPGGVHPRDRMSQCGFNPDTHRAVVITPVGMYGVAAEYPEPTNPAPAPNPEGTP